MGGETVETTERCYCLDMFRKKDPDAHNECLKMGCGRYKLEKSKAENSGKPISIKEINRRKRELRKKESASYL